MEQKTYKVTITQELEIQASSIGELSTNVEFEVTQLLDQGQGLDYTWQEITDDEK